MNIRPATMDDVRAVGQRRETCRALVAEEAGEVHAVFGIYPFSTRWVMFAWATNEFRANKRGVVAAIRAMQQLIADRPAMPVVAHADPEIPGSDVLLKHLGFKPLDEEGLFTCGKHLFR